MTIDQALAEVNLVAVTISMVNRGKPNERDEICMLTDSDIAELSSENGRFGPLQPMYQGKPKARDENYTTLSNDRLSTCRQIIGFVKCGRYTPSQGATTGIGFITLKALLTLLSETKFKLAENDHRGLLCLIRPGDSRQYRYAMLNILV